MKRTLLSIDAHISATDLQTGEITKGGKFVYTHNKTLHPEPYYMAHQEGHRELSRMNLSGKTRQVLDAVLARLDYSQRFTLLSPAEIARDLNMRSSHVCRALRELCERAILSPGPKHGRTNSYKLNDVYGWKGTSNDLIKQRRANLTLIKTKHQPAQ